MVISGVRSVLVPHHPPGALILGDGRVNGEGMVVGFSRPDRISQGEQVGAQVEPGEVQVAAAQSFRLFFRELGGVQVIAGFIGLCAEYGQHLCFLFWRVDHQVDMVEITPAFLNLVVGHREIGHDQRVLGGELAERVIIGVEGQVMPHPIIVGRVVALLDHHRVTGSDEALDRLQVASDPYYRLQVGSLFDEGHHLGGQDILVVLAGSQVGSRIALIARPIPIGESHGEIGWSAVVELLVFVFNAGEHDLGWDGGWGGCHGGCG